MKKFAFMVAAFAAAFGVTAYAYTEVTETMVVELTDGTTASFNVEDVQRVSFDRTEETIGLLVTDADGNEAYRSETLAPLFRYVPEQEGQRVKFLFGSAENVATLGDLSNGQFVYVVEMANSALYQGEVSFTGATPSATITAYEYADGEIIATDTDVTAGYIYTTRNAKGVMTVEIEATFATEAAVRASYEGTPTDVTSLDELFPPAGVKNELKYYNQDGQLTLQQAIDGVVKTEKSNGWWKLQFVIDGAASTKYYIEIDPEFVGQTIDFSNLESQAVNFYANSIQVSGPNDQYRNVGTNGTITVINNGDGTISISIDVTNQYKSPFGSTGGDPSRVVINYNGECEGLAVEPKHEINYYNQDGENTINLDIEGVQKTVKSNGWWKLQFVIDGAASSKYYIEIDPEFVGQTIDFSNLESQAVNFCANTIQVSGPNEQYRNVGTNGTITVIDNGDGTISINADVTNQYKSPFSSTGGDPSRAVIAYEGAYTAL